MRIVYHLGVQCTDEDRLLRCLLKNRAALASEGIVVPGPTRYRTLLRDTAMQLRGQTATQDTQALLLDQIMDEDRAERLILSWTHFLGYPKSALRETLYPAGPSRMAAFAAIFPEIEHEFHLAIRNPATFVPALFAKQKGIVPAEFLAGTDLSRLRWSDLVAGLRSACPDVPVTVWCDEDTPLLWPDALQAVSGHSDALVLAETDDLLAEIMTPEGMARMSAYLDDHPPADAVQRRRIVQAFLAKFARPEVIDMAVDFEGMDAALVAAMTAEYDRDVGRLMRMDGVRVLAP